MKREPPVDPRQAELKRLLEAKNGKPRSPLTGTADPFADYSLTDLFDEMAILEAAGAAWGRKFCQASTGGSRSGGGCYVSYDGFTPRSVIHPEVFLGKSTEVPNINFWAEYLHRGLAVARAYALPFTVLVQFEDGLFVWTPTGGELPAPTVGTRLAKGAAYADHYNLVISLATKDLKQVSRKK